MSVAEITTPLLIGDGVPLEAWDDGSVRLTGTRLTFDAVIACHQAGQSTAEIAENHGPTQEALVASALAYYKDHIVEVEEYLKRRSNVADDAWATWERHPGVGGLGQRLRERKAARDAAATG